ncbi:DUF167 family protein [Zhongshania borealis]|uniref:UPF0235 protein GCM10022414_17490 n=1 Tax=Zhongshania borealis TaxID=889488 RepID=A0ABP7WQE3_9GAMM
MTDAQYYQWQDDDLILFCHIQPKASANEFSGQHGDRLKIRITAAATDGKANAGLIAFVAAEFGVSKQRVRLSAGSQSRQKTLRIQAPTSIPDALNKVIK